MIRAGRLRHIIKIEEPVEIQNPATGAMEISSWETVVGCAKVPAGIEPLSTRDFISAQAQQSEVRGRIVIRYRQGLSSKMRAAHQKKGQTIYYYFEGTPMADKDSGLDYLTIPVGEGVIAQ
jgi:SPP1 family predicted phage head-tail adaptor